VPALRTPRLGSRRRHWCEESWGGRSHPPSPLDKLNRRPRRYERKVSRRTPIPSTAQTNPRHTPWPIERTKRSPIAPIGDSSAGPGVGKNCQVLVVCVLVAACLPAPFFFCLGFLASRLDRFCSLFATALSFHVSRRRICCRCAAIQSVSFCAGALLSLSSPFVASWGGQEGSVVGLGFLARTCRKSGANSGVRDRRLGFGEFPAPTRFHELLDHQCGSADDFDPSAQCPNGTAGSRKG
jgi:hypothetical protein